jgi:hypothetical protein
VGTELLHADGETDGQTEEKGGESWRSYGHCPLFCESSKMRLVPLDVPFGLTWSSLYTLT